MAHLALYRKYRPQTFAELVGQADTARVLQNAVKSGRTVHAYLFCGTRGTGKTSTARILAKALNCQQPQAGEPCNDCAACRGVMEGRSLDVIEIDAASNRGIDEARDLLEKVHFIPAEGRYKIYIIDEVHMLTNDAFNALLKTFEEPPAHVVFILATTEARKVPLTILSRCQRYDFKMIGKEEIGANLGRIAAAEGLAIDDEARQLLAAKAKGSMRDALSLLDQVSGEGSNRITADAVTALLGAVAGDFWPRFLRQVAANEVNTLFDTVVDLERRGKDIRSFFQDWQELLGDILAGGDGGCHGDSAAACRDLLSDEAMLTIITIIGEGEMYFRYNKDARMVYRFLMAKILRALHHTEALAEVTEAPTPKTTSTTAAASAAAQVEPAAPAEREAAPLTVKRPRIEAPALVEEDDEERNAALQSQFFLAVRSEAPKTYTWLAPSQVTAVTDDAVTITYENEHSPHYQHITAEEHMAVLTEILTAQTGKPMRVSVSVQRQKTPTEGSLFE